MKLRLPSKADSSSAELLPARAEGLTQRRQSTTEGLGLLKREAVGLADVVDRVNGSHPQHAVVLMLQQEKAGLKLTRRRCAQVEDGDPLDAAFGGEVVGALRVAAVHDHDDVVTVPRGRGRVETRTTRQKVTETLLEFPQRVPHEPYLPEGVGVLGVQYVRQPLHPVPVTHVLLRSAHGDQEFVGTVPGADLRNHGTDQPTTFLGVATEVHFGETAQVHATGRSLTTALVLRNRRSAAVHNGSRSSTGLEGGTRIGVANCCGPRPIRTTAKSPSPERRSHNLALVAVDHNVSGSGWR